MTSSVRAATASDRDAVVATLTSAFAQDPALLWFMGHPTDAESRCVPLFERVVDVEVAKGGDMVELADGVAAVAVWNDLDDWKTPTAELVRALPALVRTFRWRTFQTLRALTMIEAEHPDPPHRYLAFLGVRQGCQGRGLGSALLSSMTERCDDEGVPCYLENSNPRNTPLYARFGFVERGLIDLPKSAPPVLAMWREPR